MEMRAMDKKATGRSNYLARHKRSKSGFESKDTKDAVCSSDKAFRQAKLDCGNLKAQSEINKEVLQPGREIVQLERHLKDQQVARGDMERALRPSPAPIALSNERPMLKPAKELIREIATIELEVKHLEQYLLTLYRRAFEQQVPAFSPLDHRDAPKLSVSSQSSQLQETPEDAMVHSSCPSHGKRRNGTMEDWSQPTCPEKAMDPSHVLRCQSALPYRGVCSSRISSSEESLARALRSCHSQPFSFLEEAETATSGVISLADYLGTNIVDHIPETPNNLSEEMVRCMAGIYCKIADPPLVHHHSSPAPSSSLSSISAVSPQHLGDIWSPNCRREASLDSRLINPFRVEGLKEFSGPYNSMVEVTMISRDHQRLREVEHLLQTYKLILYRLETVDLTRMTNEEKLAFWINTHNALLMQAYLKYGIPHNNLKKASLLVKAACRIAGSTINAAVIQGLVLGCNMHCPGQWLTTLLHSRIKSKVHRPGNEWQAFAIDQQEPLLRFALCSGSHSDPAVRVYTPKRLFQQLEAARQEYIRATVGIWKEQKVLLPRLVEAYAKEMNLSSQALVDMVRRCVPDGLRTAMQRCKQERSDMIVGWVPYRMSFRYLLARDIVFPHLS